MSTYYYGIILKGAIGNLSILVLIRITDRIQECHGNFYHRGIGPIVRILWDQLP